MERVKRKLYGQIGIANCFEINSWYRDTVDKQLMFYIYSTILYCTYLFYMKYFQFPFAFFSIFTPICSDAMVPFPSCRQWYIRQVLCMTMMYLVSRMYLCTKYLCNPIFVALKNFCANWKFQKKCQYFAQKSKWGLYFSTNFIIGLLRCRSSHPVKYWTVPTIM